MVAGLVAQSARLARQYLTKFACENGSYKRLGKLLSYDEMTEWALKF